MFANISGALETPYQDAPLDLCEDTFYYARKDLIEARLAEIRDGKAPEILQRHDEQYREKETWCVGLSWELCDRGDLLDIVKVYPLAIYTNPETNLRVVPRWKALVNDLQVILRRL
jgi:Fanconi-associated nuclease 1